MAGLIVGTINAGGGGDLVDDTSPQLGGDLDLNGNDITGTGDITTTGVIDLTHTATENDDHALEIDCNAAGFGDVKAIDIHYTTGDVAAGEDEAVILASIDESATTGGDISAFEVLSTSEGSAQINGLFCGVNVNPLEHLSGTFGDADNVDVNGVDKTTELADGGAGNEAAFTNDDDYVIVGDAAEFYEIEFILGTGASGNGIAPTWEYSTGEGTWATFSPVDGTAGMKSSGAVAWLNGDIPSWATGAGTEYLIRVTRTRNSLSTTPVLDEVQIAAPTEYKWDKDANLTVNDVNTGDVTLTGYTRWFEDSAPSGVANYVYAWAEDNGGTTELNVTCGAGGNVVTLCDESGNIKLGTTQRLILDGADTYIDSPSVDRINMRCDGTLAAFFRDVGIGIYTDITTYSNAALYLNGSLNLGSQTRSSWPATMDSDKPVNYLDVSGEAGGVTLTLGTAVAGRQVTLTDTGSAGTYNITIAPSSGDAIAGAATSLVIDTNLGSVTLHAKDATTWYIVGGQGYTAT